MASGADMLELACSLLLMKLGGNNDCRVGHC